jgi:hypothetical protein
MWNLFKQNRTQSGAVKELVSTDLSVIPRNKISRFVATDNSYFKIVPGRLVSCYCRVPKTIPANTRISAFS